MLEPVNLPWGPLHSMPNYWLQDQGIKLYHEIYTYILLNREFRTNIDTNDLSLEQLNETRVDNYNTLCLLIRRKDKSEHTKVKLAVQELVKNGLITQREYDNKLYLKINFDFKYEVNFNKYNFLSKLKKKNKRVNNGVKRK